MTSFEVITSPSSSLTEPLLHSPTLRKVCYYYKTTPSNIAAAFVVVVVVVVIVVVVVML